MSAPTVSRRRSALVARAWRRALPLVVVITIGMHTAVAATTSPARPADSTAPAAAPSRPVSVKDSPGYVPLVDPESMSVVLGRRTNAPVVSRPLVGGGRSLEELGKMVCGALHRSDTDSLMRLCVTDEEFRDILWREFPQSRPVTGLHWEDGWRVLDVRLRSGMRAVTQELGGHHYEFLRFEVDSLAVYKNFRLHSRLTMVVRDDAGQVQRWLWLRAIVERKGRFKVYSTRD
jgi:hypothetical protein